jgi:2-polyprenyl-6-methoxyphenol hydroxylase-like FAD-dependent oxidoreductase
MESRDDLSGATFDVVVAGGSFAGSATAMAFANHGARVLLCEPGLANEKRLAGELLQPTAVVALEALGLADAVWDAGAIPSCGFSIFAGRGAKPTVLSYAEVPGLHPSGLAIEHATLARVLLARVGEHPRVTVVQGRVLPPERRAGSELELELDLRGHTARVKTPLVVAADGRSSKLREAAGIATTRGTAQRMLGVRLIGARLPTEGYGHVFLGGRSPVLAYRIGPREVRMMFEVEEGAATMPELSDLAALPADLAAAAVRECAARRAQSAVIYPISTRRRTGARIALVGDAGGAAHPITASGVAFCFSDALALADAWRDAAGDLDDAFDAFEAARREPAVTRHLLAPALRSALGGDGEAMRALREGLLHYWRTDARGRAASMALLSTKERRPAVVAREYGKVVGMALRRMPDPSVGRLSRVGWELGKASWTIASTTLRSALVDERSILRELLVKRGD